MGQTEQEIAEKRNLLFLLYLVWRGPDFNVIFKDTA